MRLFLCLFILCCGGIALLILPPHLLQLPATTGSSLVYRWWRASVSLFVIPVLLLLAEMIRIRFVVGFRLGWALWVTFLSLWILLRAPNEIPETGWYGLAFVAAMMMAALGAVLATVVQLKSRPAKHDPAGPPEK